MERQDRIYALHGNIGDHARSPANPILVRDLLGWLAE
jgi:hypothetical protein